jgi:hypothetical protein
MPQEPQAWGGEVHVPGWLRRLLRRPSPGPTDTPEAAHQARKAHKAGDQAAFEHMQATGSVEAHHSELPGGKNYRRH